MNYLPTRIISLALGLMLWAGACWAQQPGTATLRKVPTGITMRVPDALVPMPAEQAATRFVMANKLLAAFYIPNRPVNLTLTERSAVWKKEDLELMKSFYKASLSSLFTQVQFKREEIAKVNGKKVVQLEYVGTVSEEGKRPLARYGFVQYLHRGKTIVVVHFECPAMDEGLWRKPAAEMMASTTF